MKETALSKRWSKKTKAIMDQYGVNLEVTLEKGVNTFILQKLN